LKADFEMEEGKTEMEYRYLGKTGLKVSLIGFGAPMTPPTENQEEFIETTYECLKLGVEKGINFIDTAEAYGLGVSETIMGKIFPRLMADLHLERKDLVITCKMFKGPTDLGLSRKHIIEGVKASLTRMNLQYVDIIFAHRPDLTTPTEEMVRAFNSVIESGHAFYWGIFINKLRLIFTGTSEFTNAQILEINEICEKYGLIKPVVEQAEYNLMIRKRFEVDLVPLYDKYGFGTTIW
jgi:aryl-alcohol dehydrogenase-like predicted oxidoreductase